MIIWLVWTVPILLAIAVAARRSAPGPWLDRLLHFFGVGAIDSRRAAICALVIVAVIGWATDAILAQATALDAPWRQLDGLGIGAIVALSVLLLAGWLNPSSGQKTAPISDGEDGEPSARTSPPAHAGEEH